MAGLDSPQLKPISSFEKRRAGSMPHRRKNIITINPSPLYQCIAFGGVVGIKRKWKEETLLQAHFALIQKESTKSSDASLLFTHLQNKRYNCFHGL